MLYMHVNPPLEINVSYSKSKKQNYFWQAYSCILSFGWFPDVWITQKKEHNIQNTAKVWNHESLYLHSVWRNCSPCTETDKRLSSFTTATRWHPGFFYHTYVNYFPIYVLFPSLFLTITMYACTHPHLVMCVLHNPPVPSYLTWSVPILTVI